VPDGTPPRLDYVPTCLASIPDRFRCAGPRTSHGLRDDMAVPENNERRPENRRTQTAAQTQDLILQAALTCFSRAGYARTTIAEIAREAGVAVATVYTSVGGKPVLLERIFDDSIEDEGTAQGLKLLAEAGTGREVIDILGFGTLMVTQRQIETIRLMIGTAVSEPVAAAALERAVVSSHAAMEVGARRLLELDALRDDLELVRATEALWYFFGFYSWERMMRRGSTWQWEEAAVWLRQAAARTLLREPGEHS
jgi:AcrR family transcriptional regulator